MLTADEAAAAVAALRGATSGIGGCGEVTGTALALAAFFVTDGGGCTEGGGGALLAEGVVTAAAAEEEAADITVCLLLTDDAWDTTLDLPTTGTVGAAVEVAAAGVSDEGGGAGLLSVGGG